MSRRDNRPSPSVSATLYDAGDRMRGNDGNMYQIVQSYKGTNRWSKLAKDSQYDAGGQILHKVREPDKVVEMLEDTGLYQDFMNADNDGLRYTIFQNAEEIIEKGVYEEGGEVYDEEYQDEVHKMVSDLTEEEYENFCSNYDIDPEDASQMQWFIGDLDEDDAEEVMSEIRFNTNYNERNYAKGGIVRLEKLELTYNPKTGIITEDDDPDESYHIRNWVASGPRDWLDSVAVVESDRKKYEKEINYLESEQMKENYQYKKGGEISSATFEEVSGAYGVPMKALKDYAKSKNLTNKTLEDKVSSHYIGTYVSDAQMAEENNLEEHLDDNNMVKPEMYSIYGDNSYFTEFNYKKGGKTQGYDDKEDESLGMRTGKESSKKQKYKARREDSYGKWGTRDKKSKGKKENEMILGGLAGFLFGMFFVK